MLPLSLHARPLAIAALVLVAFSAVAPVTRTGSGSSASGSPWAPPFGLPPQVSAAYRAPPTPYAAGHRGIDLEAPALMATAPILSPEGGTVVFVGSVVDRPVITLRIDERTLVSLEPVASDLEAGDSVSRGARIGVLSAGGHCDGRCMHLGVRVDGEYVNPARYLLERPVLLPLGE